MEVFYICDRMACPRCNGECKYTNDIRHAANFIKSDLLTDTIYEKEKKEGGGCIVSVPFPTTTTNDETPWVHIAIILSLVSLFMNILIIIFAL